MVEQIIQNPITDNVKQSIKQTKDKLKIAVPFLSSYAKQIIESKVVESIKEKKLLTRFESISLSSFDIPTLEFLLNIGFQIRYDNSIHLKLYITDNNVFITSSNLTESGFTTNKELTVKIDSSNFEACNNVFEELWLLAKSNFVSQELLDTNKPIFEYLKRREKFKNQAIVNINSRETIIDTLDVNKLIDKIFKQKKGISKIIEYSYEANKIRKEFKNKLLNGFNIQLFYVSKTKNKKRNQNLFYEFVYGYESSLAGTGLREAQFKEAFEHPDFPDAISFIYPQMIKQQQWNLDDDKSYLEFCCGLFDFNIPQYNETLPIRLASFLYPEYFFPIFKIDDLEKICLSLGIETNATDKGEKLYAYNSFLRDWFKSVPYNNYVKSDFAYRFLYAVLLYEGLQNGETYNIILKKYNKAWKRELIENGRNLLIKLKIINE